MVVMFIEREKKVLQVKQEAQINDSLAHYARMFAPSSSRTRELRVMCYCGLLGLVWFLVTEFSSRDSTIIMLVMKTSRRDNEC